VQEIELEFYEARSLCNGFCSLYTKDEENIDYDEKSSFYLYSASHSLPNPAFI